jgi:LPXTG-motif cell wall-anchored protein
MDTFLAATNSDYNLIYVIVGVLLIIALFMFILGRRG